MHFRVKPLLGLLAVLAAMPAAARAAGPDLRPLFYEMHSDEPGPWPAILSSIGLHRAKGHPAAIHVLLNGAEGDAALWRKRMEEGAIVILEGESALASAFGFSITAKRVPVRNLSGVFNPAIPVIWERSLWLDVFRVPDQARVYARDRWSGAPLVAGIKTGRGGLLWLAVTPGVNGYERFPFLPQALLDLGWTPRLKSRRLWAFCDPSYRMRVDLDYFARLWRQMGIAALHVAAWHFFETSPERDAWLRKLIEACHNHGVLVFAWLELPHVSERFWEDHPAWREQTALLQDAFLDWRKLMNLQHPDCFQAAAAGVRSLLGRFDWDGVNLAELYFESLEGHANAARFTPMNQQVRREFAATGGFDPLELFQPDSPRAAARNPEGLRAFLDYRAGLAARMQQQWIGEIEAVRRDKPHMEMVLTHVDDRFDNRMRDLIGADAARLLPLLERHDFTFLIEDPATLWHLGPERYTQLAGRYQPLTSRPHKLAIDINIVERYQDVYPTRQQTGIELFQLVHTAAQAFPRVALYFENSILPADRPLLAAAAAVCERVEVAGGKLVVASPHGAGISWEGPLRVNGRLWAATDGSTAWLPAGEHSLEPAAARPALRLLDFTGQLHSATASANALELAYSAASRCFAYLDAEPERVEIDGVEEARIWRRLGATWVLTLPRGQHLVLIHRAPSGDEATPQPTARLRQRASPAAQLNP